MISGTVGIVIDVMKAVQHVDEKIISGPVNMKPMLLNTKIASRVKIAKCGVLYVLNSPLVARCADKTPKACPVNPSESRPAAFIPTSCI